MIAVQSERELWERKYRVGNHPSGTLDSFLVEAHANFVAPAFPQGGRVLDVAGGMGRHALFYARQGWQVTLIDISEHAAQKAREAAERERLSLTLYVADLDDFRWQQWSGRFDLVLIFFYLQRKLFPALAALLGPGGLLLYKTHLRSETNSPDAPKNPAHVLEPGELRYAFPGLEVLRYQERLTARSTAEIVVRKR